MNRIARQEHTKKLTNTKLLAPQRTRRTQRQTKYEEEHVRVKRKFGAVVTTDTKFQLSNFFALALPLRPLR